MVPPSIQCIPNRAPKMRTAPCLLRLWHTNDHQHPGESSAPSSSGTETRMPLHAVLSHCSSPFSAVCCWLWHDNQGRTPAQLRPRGSDPSWPAQGAALHSTIQTFSAIFNSIHSCLLSLSLPLQAWLSDMKTDFSADVNAISSHQGQGGRHQLTPSKDQACGL